MRANPAEYRLVSPGTLQGVLELLAQEPGQWMPIAGGTELMVQFGAGRLAARRLVNIFGLPELTAIVAGPTSIRIGAGVTYAAIRRHAEIAARLPLLARAAGWTGAIANQNRGTLGGNLVNGSPAADSPPALLVYDATLELVSVRGIRRLPYTQFHTGYKRTQLAPDELLLSVEVPWPDPAAHQYLRKVGPRNAMAISKVALAALASAKGGRVNGARIALASVSHSPYRCVQTEALLEGSALTGELVTAARAALTAEIAPLDDIRSTAKYRSHVAGNLLQEFLGQLLAEGGALAGWNRAETADAEAKLLACCGSRRWAAELVARRPFSSADDLMQAAEALWFSLSEADWLEAFACHPRIGERKPATTDYLASSESEQAAAQQTLDGVAEKLLTGNREYEARFGFLYIVFASGRSAPELLAVLEERLTHTREEELQEAARQQQRIANLRMERWLNA
jgi:OHCU decarboxylase